MLNERYGLIDYQTMFWELEHSPEPREGMLRLHGETPAVLDCPTMSPPGENGLLIYYNVYFHD